MYLRRRRYASIILYITPGIYLGITLYIPLLHRRRRGGRNREGMYILPQPTRGLERYVLPAKLKDRAPPEHKFGSFFACQKAGSNDLADFKVRFYSVKDSHNWNDLDNIFSATKREAGAWS